MPGLVAFLRSIFQGQLAFWLSMFEKRMALRLAWIAFALSLIVGLFAAVNALLAGLSMIFPYQLTTAASWVVPSNLDQCITAYFAAHVAVYVFEWKLRISSKYAY